MALFSVGVLSGPHEMRRLHSTKATRLDSRVRGNDRRRMLRVCGRGTNDSLVPLHLCDVSLWLKVDAAEYAERAGLAYAIGHTGASAAFPVE